MGLRQPPRRRAPLQRRRRADCQNGAWSTQVKNPETQIDQQVPARLRHVAVPGSAVDNVLRRLENVKRIRNGWMARCPAHEDKQNSLSIAVGRNGQVLLKCFAGCDVEAIARAVGLALRDLFEQQGGGGAGIPPRTPATAQHSAPGGGLTLEQYSQAKRLPVEFLHSLGISQIHLQGQPALRIPYMDASGNEVAVRFRLALEGESKFRWRSGARPCLYGLQRLDDARKAGQVVLVEGESDAQTLWLHGIHALGVPGANNWREEWAGHLEGIQLIYVVIEPDAGGEATKKWLAESSIRERVRLVTLGPVKDPSGLYLSDPDRFLQRFNEALAASVPWADQQRVDTDRKAREAWEKCKALACAPRILECLAATMEAAGVVGESRVVRLLYLALTSRLLDKPVSVAIKGPSAGGKSFVVQRVLEFFPESAYYALSAMSEHALAYSEEPLIHRMLVIYEAAGLGSDFASYLMRSLLSEGRVRYETVDKTKDGMKPRLIEREGPTGLLVTTTHERLHAENETRLLSVTVTDTPDQTRSVMLALAEGNDAPGDLPEWHALQEWLQTAEHGVAVPFARALADAIPPVAVRLRRDFSAILSLIKAHAILHQASRERDSEGWVIASVDDYGAVHDLVADLVASGVEAAVPDTVRETVEAARRLLDEGASAVTVTAVARELRLDKSAASRRVRSAVDRGYLRNTETVKGRPARLVLDEPMPDEVEVLPSPDSLSRCAVAGVSTGIDAPLPPSLQREWAGWSEEQRYAFDERVGILMFERGLLSAEAARQAAQCVRREFGL